MLSWASLELGATLVLSTTLSVYLTPLIRRGAITFGVLDRPDGRLKTQHEAIPYLGGVAVYLSFLVTLALVFDFQDRLLGLLLGGTLLLMLGLFDDLRVLTPSLKFIGQLLGAWVLMKSHISIQLVAVPWFVLMPLTIVWLVGITNALNIVDVADGLASGVAAIAAAALFFVAQFRGDQLIAITTLALFGSTVGFLYFNWSPARIYLGDAGSLFLGFMLAALAMNGTYTQRSPWGALAPVFILIVPILDTCLVSVARTLQGIPPWRGSPDHFALRLRKRGWSVKQVAGFAYILGFLGAASGIFLTLGPPRYAPLITCGAALIFVSVGFWLLLLKKDDSIKAG